jgi:hypothetical protein
MRWNAGSVWGVWAGADHALRHDGMRSVTVRMLFAGLAGLTGSFWHLSAG